MSSKPNKPAMEFRISGAPVTHSGPVPRLAVAVAALCDTLEDGELLTTATMAAKLGLTRSAVGQIAYHSSLSGYKAAHPHYSNWTVWGSKRTITAYKEQQNG